MLGNFPGFTLGTMAIGGGVKDDTVILFAPLKFSTAVFYRILNHPANRAILQIRDRGIAASPTYDVRRCIDMGDIGSGQRSGQRTSARVGKQVQDF